MIFPLVSTVAACAGIYACYNLQKSRFTRLRFVQQYLMYHRDINQMKYLLKREIPDKTSSMGKKS